MFNHPKAIVYILLTKFEIAKVKKNVRTEKINDRGEGAKNKLTK